MGGLLLPWRGSKNCCLLGAEQEEQLAGIREIYSILMRRVITGVLLGVIVGAIQVGFMGQDLNHLWAAMASGVIYMAAWVVLTNGFQLGGGKILLGAVSGLLAAIVWWAIAIHAENLFLTAAVAGACFGATYAWSDQRMT